MGLYDTEKNIVQGLPRPSIQIKSVNKSYPTFFFFFATFTFEIDL